MPKQRNSGLSPEFEQRFIDRYNQRMAAWRASNRAKLGMYQTGAETLSTELIPAYKSIPKSTGASKPIKAAKRAYNKKPKPEIELSGVLAKAVEDASEFYDSAQDMPIEQPEMPEDSIEEMSGVRLTDALAMMSSDALSKAYSIRGPDGKFIKNPWRGLPVSILARQKHYNDVAGG